MKVISMLNNKGGVGKTASTSTIGHMMATLYNKRVLLIDVDPQGNLSSLFSPMQSVDLLVSMLKDLPLEQADKTVEDLFVNSQTDIHDCIRKTAYNNLDIIPALLTLSECEETLKADIRTPQQFRLKNHLDKIQDEYDYCIIDCSPSINILNINSLVASDEIYIPLKCDAWSATGMCITKKLVKTVQSYNNKLKLGGCFFTQYETLKNVSKTTHEILSSLVPEMLLPVTIAKSRLVEEMSFAQTPLLEYDNKKNPSKVTQDYIKLTEYIIKN